LGFIYPSEHRRSALRTRKLSATPNLQRFQVASESLDRAGALQIRTHPYVTATLAYHCAPQTRKPIHRPRLASINVASASGQARRTHNQLSGCAACACCPRKPIAQICHPAGPANAHPNAPPRTPPTKAPSPFLHPELRRRVPHAHSRVDIHARCPRRVSIRTCEHPQRHPRRTAHVPCCAQTLPSLACVVALQRIHSACGYRLIRHR